MYGDTQLNNICGKCKEKMLQDAIACYKIQVTGYKLQVVSYWMQVTW